MRKIVTTHICPPIPDRQYDWCAHYEGMEETFGNYGYGYGATEVEAIADFIENHTDHASLISAAPELFERAHDLLEIMEDFRGDYSDPAFSEALVLLEDETKAAIVKAEGRS